MRESDMLKGMAVFFFGSTFSAIILLLIFREMVCWYWKINAAIRLLTSIDDRLRRLAPQSNRLEDQGGAS